MAINIFLCFLGSVVCPFGQVGGYRRKKSLINLLLLLPDTEVTRKIFIPYKLNLTLNMAKHAPRTWRTDTHVCIRCLSKQQTLKPVIRNKN